MFRRLVKAIPRGQRNSAAVPQRRCLPSRAQLRQTHRLAAADRRRAKPAPDVTTACRSLRSALLLHLTQSSRRSCTPFAAADSGSRASFTSIHAQTFPSLVLSAINASARQVLPEVAGPVISLMAPTGKPPESKLSISAMPVAAVSRIVCGTGDSAAGKRFSRVRSICSRRAFAEGIGVRLEFSPFVRLFCFQISARVKRGPVRNFLECIVSIRYRHLRMQYTQFAGGRSGAGLSTSWRASFMGERPGIFFIGSQ